MTTQRQRKMFLWTTLLTLGLCILATLTWGWCGTELPSSAPNPKSIASNSEDMDAEQLGPIANYTCIYKRSLGKPLFDLKPLALIKEKPKFQATLTGTALEPGFTYGFFKTPAGQTKMVLVGESIEGAKVLAIRKDSAILLWCDEKITLVVKKEGH